MKELELAKEILQQLNNETQFKAKGINIKTNKQFENINFKSLFNCAENLGYHITWAKDSPYSDTCVKSQMENFIIAYND